MSDTYGRFNDFTKLTSSGFDDGFEVLESLLGLGLDSAFNLAIKLHGKAKRRRIHSETSFPYCVQE